MRFISLILITLFSCSLSLKEEDCLRDMESIGYQDSMKGISSVMFSTYSNLCQWSDITNKKKQYLKGYKKGSESYCSRRTGRIIGEEDRPLPIQCKSFPAFTEAYIKSKKKAFKKKASKKLDNKN